MKYRCMLFCMLLMEYHQVQKHKWSLKDRTLILWTVIIEWMNRLVDYLQKCRDNVECSSLFSDSNAQGYYFPPKNTPKLQDWPIFQAYVSIIQVNVVSWRKLSFDEATHGFKGENSLKSVINFKKEVDGYLLYCIGEDWFIYTFSSKLLQCQINGWIKGSAPHKQEFSFCLRISPVSFKYYI